MDWDIPCLNHQGCEGPRSAAILSVLAVRRVGGEGSLASPAPRVHVVLEIMCHIAAGVEGGTCSMYTFRRGKVRDCCLLTWRLESI